MPEQQMPATTRCLVLSGSWHPMPVLLEPPKSTMINIQHINAIALASHHPNLRRPWISAPQLRNLLWLRHRIVKPIPTRRLFIPAWKDLERPAL
jgi:hypothetical protein